MKRVVLFSAVAALSAFAVQGTLIVVSPFESAKADTPPAASAGVASILDSMEPGAIVERQKDGILSFQGKLKPSNDAEVSAAAARLAAGPHAVQCKESGRQLVCTPIADQSVRAAVMRGETVYHRAYYRGITDDVITNRVPLLEAAELVCTETVPLVCERVDVIEPRIRRGETIFMTYRPFHVVVRDDGTKVVALGNPSVPLSWTE